MSYFGSNFWASNYWGSNYWGAIDEAVVVTVVSDGLQLPAGLGDDVYRIAASGDPDYQVQQLASHSYKLGSFCNLAPISANTDSYGILTSKLTFYRYSGKTFGLSKYMVTTFDTDSQVSKSLGASSFKTSSTGSGATVAGSL